ncbi:MAG TPA: ABC transporter substrate-binding protein [Candidatus Acetothermia bacterium]|nr:ABC transporter substrate-binding protein [Candidatus Acetothermia bacterium]
MSRKGIVYTVFALVLALVVGTGMMALGEAGTYGGTLRCALASEPGTLDMQMTTGVAASIPARHILEGLFAFDATYTPQPMLAESWELSKDGTVATFHLRHGVLFQNGQEMTSADVLASLDRWGKYGLTSKALWSHVVKLSAPDAYTVVMQLDQPFAPMTTYLANIYGGPSIYPKAVVDKAGNQPIAPKDLIGTGPYKFVEWKSGDYMLLERFDKYVPVSTPASGFAGDKVAYFDKLQFFFVADNNARLVGIKSGTYDYVVNIPSDLYSTIKDNKSIIPILTNHPPIYPIMLINNKTGLLATNYTLKQAILAALDMTPIMQAGYGDKMFWRLDGSYFASGIRWYTKTGTQLYNQNDPTKAKQLMKEAGYNGEPINMIVAQDMTAQYNQALVVKYQLEQVGFKVDLQVYDKATFFARRNDVKNPQWQLAFSFYSTTPDPSLVLMLNPNYAGWWNSPKIQTLRNELNQITDFKARYAKWEEIMTLWYQQIPAIKFGDAYQLHLMRSDILGGYGTEARPPMVSPYFWNSWK